MALIVTPLYTQRTFDGRVIEGTEVDVLEASRKIKDRINRGTAKAVLIRLRSPNYIQSVVDSGGAMSDLLSFKVCHITRDGGWDYTPSDSLVYSKMARRFVPKKDENGEYEIYPFRVGDKDKPGEPVTVPFLRAVVLLRYQPEGWGFLFEELDSRPAELVPLLSQVEMPEPTESSETPKRRKRKAATLPTPGHEE